MYLASVVLILLVHAGLEIATKKKVEDLGYIQKKFKEETRYEKMVRFISRGINIATILIPYFNIIIHGILTIVAVYSLKHDEKFLEVYGDELHTVSNVKGVHENKALTVDKELLKEELILDGASSEEAEMEVQNAIHDVKESMGVTPKKNDSTIGWYSEKEYARACAQCNAECLFEEIQADTTLNAKQKKEFMKLLRNGFLSEGKGKNDNKMAKKLLKTAE